jgi:hypothetical protein
MMQIVLGGLIAPAALAQEAAPEPADLAGGWWTIRFEPAALYGAPAGRVRFPASGTPGSRVELDDLNLDNPRLSPMGRLMATRGPWRIALSGFGFSTSDRGATSDTTGTLGDTPFAPGDRFISDLAYHSFDLSASYRVIRHRGEVDEEGIARLETTVDLVGGIRVHHTDFDVTVEPAGGPPGSSTRISADELFAEPFLGARLELDFSRTFGVDVESTIGGFTTGDHRSISFTINAGFVYRPIPVVGLRMGYHMVVFDLRDGDSDNDFQWRGSFAGLYWGAQFSF